MCKHLVQSQKAVCCSGGCHSGNPCWDCNTTCKHLAQCNHAFPGVMSLNGNGTCISRNHVRALQDCSIGCHVFANAHSVKASGTVTSCRNHGPQSQWYLCFWGPCVCSAGLQQHRCALQQCRLSALSHFPGQLKGAQAVSKLHWTLDLHHVARVTAQQEGMSKTCYGNFYINIVTNSMVIRFIVQVP